MGQICAKIRRDVLPLLSSPDELSCGGNMPKGQNSVCKMRCYYQCKLKEVEN